MRKVNYDVNGKVFLTKEKEENAKTTYNGDKSKLPKYNPGFKSFVNGREV